MIFLLFGLFALISCFPQEIQEALSRPEIQLSLQHVETLQNILSRSREKRDIPVKCALCGIAINEVEGLMIEEQTVSEIEKFLQDEFCKPLGGTFEGLCDVLVDMLPVLITWIESRQDVSTVCIELGFCEVPFPRFDDPVPVPRYTINLDLPPGQRWQHVCSQPTFKAMGQYLANTVASILPDGGKYIGDVGELLNDYYFPAEYAAEIRGCAAAMSVPYGWVTLLNIGYEVSDACTSIVAQDPSGKILHGRNLDFWAGMGFTDTLKNMTFIADFKQSGKTVFTATTFAGYVGILSGIKPGAFSVTIDTRFYPEGFTQIFYEVVAAITEKNASLVSFLSREVFERENDFPAAVSNLANGELIADVYYIVAGVSAGQGTVISRNRQNASDIWTLDPAHGRWFEVETNYDHWEQPPWIDNRVDPANKGMNAMGPQGVTLQGIYNVLSTKPVFNIQTTYTILAVPANGTYQCWARYCNYPCTE